MCVRCGVDNSKTTSAALEDFLGWAESVLETESENNKELETEEGELYEYESEEGSDVDSC